MQLEKFYKSFQDHNPEKFNPRLFQLKTEDDPLPYIKDACKGLESVNGIEFLGARKITEKKPYKPKSLSKVKGNKTEKIKYFEIDYEETRYDSYEINFRLTYGDTSKEIKRIINFPTLLDGYYFYINSVKYYPIFQIVDAESYRSKKGVIMRTALQPIVINKDTKSVDLKDSSGEVVCSISNISCLSNIFKTKVPVFLYFFAKYGVFETIEYFGLPFDIITNDKYEEEDSDDYYYHELGKFLYLKIPSEYVLKEDNFKETLLLTFLDSFKNNDKIEYEDLNNIDYWVTKLGGQFSKNPSNYYGKGLSVQYSFERLLDDTTKKIIRLDPKDKTDIYSLVRWFLWNYHNLLRQNADDLANKRLRLNECYIFPLLEKWTQGVLSILNAKNVNLKKLEQLFSNLDKNFLIKQCVTSAENLRYMNTVNSFDVTNKLKLTTQGPQSITDAKGEIKGKSLDISMIGRIDLVYTSNADPGTTRMLTPFCDFEDWENWHFYKKPNLLDNDNDYNENTINTDDVNEEDLYEDIDFDMDYMFNDDEDIINEDSFGFDDEEE